MSLEYHCLVNDLLKMSLKIFHCLLSYLSLSTTALINFSDESNSNGEKMRLELELDGSISFPLLIFNACESVVCSAVCGDESKRDAAGDFSQDYRSSTACESVLGTFHRQISYAETEDGRRSSSVNRSTNVDVGDNFKFSWYCSHLESLYSRYDSKIDHFELFITDLQSFFDKNKTISRFLAPSYRLSIER